MASATEDPNRQQQLRIKVIKRRALYLASGGFPLSEQRIRVDSGWAARGWEKSKELPHGKGTPCTVAAIPGANPFVMVVIPGSDSALKKRPPRSPTWCKRPRPTDLSSY